MNKYEIQQFKYKNNHVTVLIRITGIFAKVKEWRDGMLSFHDTYNICV